jgi:hypothetical protein
MTTTKIKETQENKNTKPIRYKAKYDTNPLAIVSPYKASTQRLSLAKALELDQPRAAIDVR